jgi:hypothetical protein
MRSVGDSARCLKMIVPILNCTPLPAAYTSATQLNTLIETRQSPRQAKSRLASLACVCGNQARSQCYFRFSLPSYGTNLAHSEGTMA